MFLRFRQLVLTSDWYWGMKFPISEYFRLTSVDIFKHFTCLLSWCLNLKAHYELVWYLFFSPLQPSLSRENSRKCCRSFSFFKVFYGEWWKFIYSSWRLLFSMYSAVTCSTFMDVILSFCVDSKTISIKFTVSKSTDLCCLTPILISGPSLILVSWWRHESVLKLSTS